jgi:hypothetical protein
VLVLERLDNGGYRYKITIEKPSSASSELLLPPPEERKVKATSKRSSSTSPSKMPRTGSNDQPVDNESARRTTATQSLPSTRSAAAASRTLIGVPPVETAPGGVVEQSMTNVQRSESPSVVQHKSGDKKRKTAASKGDRSKKNRRLDSSNLKAPPTGRVAAGKNSQAAAAAVVPAAAKGAACLDTNATTSSAGADAPFPIVAARDDILDDSALPMDTVMPEATKAAMSVHGRGSPSTLSSSEPFIKKQKARAIHLLEQLDLNLYSVLLEQSDPKSYTATTAKKKMNDVVASVRADLKLGVVPPVYHALVRGCDPFGVNRSVSFEEVGPGSVTETTGMGPELVLEGNMWESLFSDDDGAYMNVNDQGVSPARWIFSSTETRHVVELVNAKARMIGEDLEVTENLPSVFSLEYEKSKAYTLFTRCLSRGVAASCFRAGLEAQSPLAITGSPGIGKSWTLLYLLQQALLYDDACVVFFNQHKKRAMLCVRRGKALFVWHTLAPCPAYTCLFTRDNVLVLLDPNESSNGGADYATCDGKLIYAASNNKEHFKTNAIKNRVPFQYLSPWTVHELQVALPVMKEGIEMDVVWEKAKVVGMLPRYFVKEEQVYDERKAKLDVTVSRLQKNDTEVKEILEWSGLDKTEKAAPSVSVPGTLFAVHAASIVIEGEPVEPDYDGLTGVAYRDRILHIMSDAVVEKVVKRNRAKTLAFWHKVDCSEFSAMGKAVEDLFWTSDLLPQNQHSIVCYPQFDSNEESEALLNDSEATWSQSNKEAEMANLHDIFGQQDKVFRMARGTAAINFAGPGRRVYQVTVSDNHRMSLSGMISILEEGRYLLKYPVKRYLSSVYLLLLHSLLLA